MITTLQYNFERPLNPAPNSTAPKKNSKYFWIFMFWKGKENTNTKWQKSAKTEQQTEINFFEGLLLLKSKSAQLMKVR